MRRILSAAGLWAISFTTTAQSIAENPLFNTFKQGGSNPVCAAVVKSAIGTFGVNNVFRYLLADDASKRYLIRLRDERTVVLTYSELEQAATSASFSQGSTDLLSADIRKYALLCLAVMAKRLQLQNPRYTYAMAVSDINDGLELADAVALLGLKLKALKPCTADNLSHYNHIIVQNHYHVAYANSGYYDETNSRAGIATLADFRQHHNGVKCALHRCNITEAYRLDEY